MMRSLTLLATTLLLLMAVVRAQLELAEPLVPCSKDNENGVDCSDLEWDGRRLGTFDQFVRRAAIRRPSMKAKFKLQSDSSITELKSFIKNQVTALKHQTVDDITMGSYLVSATDASEKVLEVLQSNPNVPTMATGLLEVQVKIAKDTVARQYPYSPYPYPPQPYYPYPSPSLLPIQPWWFILVPRPAPTTQEIYTALILNYIAVFSFLGQVLVNSGIDFDDLYETFLRLFGLGFESYVDLLSAYFSSLFTLLPI